MYKIFTLIVFVFSFTSLMGQKTIDVDSLYYKASQLYKEKAFTIALSKANQGLSLAPEYSDIRVLRIRITQQLKQLSIASKDLLYLHQNTTETPYLTLVKKQLSFFENTEDISSFIAQISPYYEDNFDYKLTVAETYLKVQNRKKAKKLVHEIPKKKLTKKQQYRLRELQKDLVNNTVLLNHEALTFLADFPTRKTWNTTSLGYIHSLNKGTIGANITRSHRFLDEGTLYEIEAYPQLAPKLYAHMNLSFSSKRDFFQHYGASTSLFYTILKKLELEAGFKYLDFDSDKFFSSVLGLTVYTGDYYLNLRGFLGPRIQNEFVQNYQFTARRYMKDSESYIFARVGTGISPEESIQFTQIINNPNLNSYFALAGVSKWFGNSNVAFSGGYLYQEISSTKKGSQLIGNIGLKHRF